MHHPILIFYSRQHRSTQLRKKQQRKPTAKWREKLEPPMPRIIHITTVRLRSTSHFRDLLPNRLPDFQEVKCVSLLYFANQFITAVMGYHVDPHRQITKINIQYTMTTTPLQADLFRFAPTVSAISNIPVVPLPPTTMHIHLTLRTAP